MKHLGILLCDDHPPEAIPRFGTYDNDYRVMVEQTMPGQWKYSVWRCYEQQFPPSTHTCDAWIISGSTSAVYDSLDWIQRLKSFVVKLDQAGSTLLGICFGHQLIHAALGGRVEQYSGGWGLGAYPVTLKTGIGAFSVGDVLKVLAVHEDQVVEPASDFSIVAGSDFCVHAITRKGRSILTLQSHPEFTDDFFITVCERIRDKAGAKLTDRVIGRIGLPDDRHPVGSMITRFLAGESV